MSNPFPREGLNTTESMGRKKLLCHGCKGRFAVLFPDANNKPMCVNCRPEHKGMVIVEGED